MLAMPFRCATSAGGFCRLKRGLRVRAVFGLTGRGEIDRRLLGAAAARKCGRNQGRGQRHCMGFRHSPPASAWPTLIVPHGRGGHYREKGAGRSLTRRSRQAHHVAPACAYSR